MYTLLSTFAETFTQWYWGIALVLAILASITSEVLPHIPAYERWQDRRHEKLLVKQKKLFEELREHLNNNKDSMNYLSSIQNRLDSYESQIKLLPKPLKLWDIYYDRGIKGGWMLSVLDAEGKQHSFHSIPDIDDSFLVQYPRQLADVINVAKDSYKNQIILN